MFKFFFIETFGNVLQVISQQYTDCERRSCVDTNTLSGQYVLPSFQFPIEETKAHLLKHQRGFKGKYEIHTDCVLTAKAWRKQPPK